MSVPTRTFDNGEREERRFDAVALSQKPSSCAVTHRPPSSGARSPSGQANTTRARGGDSEGRIEISAVSATRRLTAS
jgi:hypothetical protein